MFDSGFWPSRKWVLPARLGSLSVPCMTAPCAWCVTALLSSAFLLHIEGKKWHAYASWAQQLQCLSRLCVRHVDVRTKQFSPSPLPPQWLEKCFFFFICFFCHPLSFPAPATSISLLSLSATHIHCVWSSVGQRSSTEPQDWLADSWKTEGRNCTGSQVLFKMCYWPQNVKGRNSQHTFLPKHELDVFSYPLKHFITHHQCSQLKTAHHILLFFK